MEDDLLNDLINAAESLITTKEPTKNVQNVKEINIFSEENTEVKSTKTDQTENAESVVHTGLSDSSDDEDNKYFEEAKYNDYGKAIKRLLKTSSDTSNSNDTKDVWKSNSNKSKQLSLPPPKPTPSQGVYVDPFFRIRIVNPSISNKVFEERMEGRESVPMAKLKWYVQRVTPEKDWVIAGVIVQKSASRTSAKGNQFSIWSLSDLHGDLKTVSVFLFGKSHQQLWKTTVGTVVGILNPNILDKKDGSKDEACLSVDNYQKVMLLGQSKDLGTCKSTKKSGEQCTAFVNTSQTEYCVYHLKQEYQKYSKRSDTQSSFSGRGLTALRNKVLGKNEVFYAGKSYMAIPATKNRKLASKDDGRLKSLASNVAVNVNQATRSRNLTNRKMTANRVELTKNQRVKDLEILKKLGGRSDLNLSLDDKKVVEFSGSISRDVTLEESKQTALGVINKLKQIRADDQLQRKPAKACLEDIENKDVTNESIEISKKDGSIGNYNDLSKVEVTKNNNLSKVEIKTTLEAANKTRPFLNNTTNPTLNNNGKVSVDLSSPISKRLINKAKLNALNYVRKNGEIKKQDPMSVKSAGKKRKVEITGPTKENDPKKQKIQENEFFSERFKKMMAITSAHTDLLDNYDDEEKEKYFKKLEIKEKMEEKMASTYKVQCKAVRCLQCKYTSFSASDKCKAEKHPLKVFDAFKRFFQCGNCANRTACLEVVPTVACKNCGNARWERASMMKEKKVESLHNLSIRGGEQKFVNSIVTNSNLDLLVPTE